MPELRRAAEESSLGMIPDGFGAQLKTIIDVGANEGQWSSAALALIRPQHLIALEPIPAVCRRLQERLEGRSNVQVINAAVGDRDGTVPFLVTKDSTGASILPPRDDMREHVADSWDIQERIEVPIHRIDTLAGNMDVVSVLKVDVQGYEQAVFEGATETLPKTMFVLVELNFRQQYEQGSDFHSVYDLLTKRFGFYLANLSKPLMFDREAIMVDGLFANPRFVPRRLNQ